MDAKLYALQLLAQTNPDTLITPRVQRLKLDIRAAMKARRVSVRSQGDILCSETASLPLIVRKAMAERHNLLNAPVFHWRGQLVGGGLVSNDGSQAASGALPRYATDAEIAHAKEVCGFSPATMFGHIVPSYPRLLALGVSGVVAQAKKRMETAARDQVAFYEAIIISAEALGAYAARQAAHLRMLAEAADVEEAAELRAMAADFDICPQNPPSTYRQALQAAFLLHTAYHLTGSGLAMGRADQYLWPFLQADLKNGRLTQEQAQELTDCFFLKFNERGRDTGVVLSEIDADKIQRQNEERFAGRQLSDRTVQRWNVRDTVDSANHWLQNVIVGGYRPDGEDGTNLLTVMMLESFRRNGMTNPCFTLRINAQTPEWLYGVAVRVLRDGGGLPAFFNDENIVNALHSAGFPLEDCRDYTNDGCWEVLIPGRTDFYFDRFNLLKCLEWTLNHGRSRIDGKQEIPDFGDVSGATFDELLEHVYAALDIVLETLMAKLNHQYGKRAIIAPLPLLSAFFEGPMESGQDMTAGGARFTTYGLIGEAASHLIDSLSALRKVIYEDKRATLAQVIDALESNFVGSEQLRKLLRDAPKYGNNNGYADDIGQAVFVKLAQMVKKKNEVYNNLKFLPGAGTFSWYIAIGAGLGASPDGRGNAEPVASNLSPSTNAMKKGVTSAILSFAKLNTGVLPQGSPLDLGIDGRYVRGEEGDARIIALLRGFVELGGNMLTLTVTDTETLKDAVKNPERYQDLRVRMGGWADGRHTLPCYRQNSNSTTYRRVRQECSNTNLYKTSRQILGVFLPHASSRPVGVALPRLLPSTSHGTKIHTSL